MRSAPLRVKVWGEYRHEKVNAVVAGLYPQGMHATIAAALRREPDLEVTTAVLDDPDHGLSGPALAETDVLVWWGHRAHEEVSDAAVERVRERVWEGMGLVALHSAHYAKIFRALMGTPCTLKWREATDKERIWNVNPGHPIAEGLGDYFELPAEEMYGEPFGIPEPDGVIFISWFTGGEVFRSGAVWQRGNGRVFYFRPGHETYPTYHDRNVQRVIANGVRWCRPVIRQKPENRRSDPLEPLPEEGGR